MAFPTPKEVRAEFPLSPDQEKLVLRAREDIIHILRGDDRRLLVIVGPCSIHERQSALEYAKWLSNMRIKYQETLEIIMRVYFEKPRTTIGWKGLINDPYLDATNTIEDGISMARGILSEIVNLGLPVATEFLDVYTYRYLADLVSYGAIGARTTESQAHRELASYLPLPIGFKNATNGSIEIARDAIMASRGKHVFLSLDDDGMISRIQSSGNSVSHLILRGGHTPNYDRYSIQQAKTILREAHIDTRIVVDMSHGNSKKNPLNQKEIAHDIAHQITDGETSIAGVMIESHLVAGAQKYTPGIDSRDSIIYGQSITDGCIGLDGAEEIFDILSESMKNILR